MAFKLRIEFTGLCLFVENRLDGRFAVLLPDCRNGVPSTHVDGTDGIPHAGFIRTDAAAHGLSVPGAGWDGPVFEVVHRVTGQELHIDGLTPGIVKCPGGSLDLPRLNEPYFSNVEYKRDLFTDLPDGLLLRLILSGGEFVADPGDHAWKVPGWLSDTKADQFSNFSSKVTWETSREKDVELILRTFGTKVENGTKLTLKPITTDNFDLVTIRVSNLCSDNPLQWNSLSMDSVVEDHDFKWIFRLIESTNGVSIEDRIRKISPHLPFPALMPPVPRGNRNCLGARITGTF